MEDAVCTQTDPELFFPISENTVPHGAFSICATCPLVIRCLNQALAVPASHDWGVWGGTTQAERQRIRRNSKYRAVYMARLRDEYAPDKPRGRRWDKRKTQSPRNAYILEETNA